MLSFILLPIDRFQSDKTTELLSENTTSIKTMPNGQTLMGNSLSGNPDVSNQEIQLAIKYFKENNLEEALKHAQTAVNLEEQSNKGVAIRTGLNWPKMYFIAAEIAQKINNKDLANQWAEKSTKWGGQAENFALYATTLFNLGRREETQKVLKRAVMMNRNKNENSFSDLVAKIGLPN